MSRPRARPFRRLAFAALRRLMRGWVDVQAQGADALLARLDRGAPVCWALQVRQLSALVVLDEQVRRLGLPLPLAPLAAAGEGDDAAGPADALEPHSFFYLTRDGQPSPLRRAPYRYAPRLARLAAAARADAAADVTIVPVHVFWGRAPRNQDSILKALFAEGWALPGPLRHVLRVLIHGRQTLLRFGEPMSLRALVDGAEDDEHATRRAARLLRASFRRERERVIGPDLSHRHVLINAVIDAEPVRRAIEADAGARGVGRDRAEASARRAAWEIASNYSYPFIRAYDLALQLLWNRLYDGIEAHRLDTLHALPADATLVYVPCHRSHIDYLLLSYLIWQQGLPPPHVAAGANLDLPVVGGLLRRGGAFFLRRSFRGDALYGAVFAEYLHAVIARGFPVEYFVEGGRSRTGRTLAPRAGLLAMTVESWLRSPQRPLVFVPVYVGYERLLEGESYVAELAGRPKRKESLTGLLRSLGRLRERFGRVHVNIGEPIALGPFLDAHAAAGPTARGARGDAARDAARRAAIDALAHRVVASINDAAVVAPVNLVSVAMLGAPRHAMDGSELARQLDLLRELLARVPYSSRMELTPLAGEAIVAQAERTGLLWRIPHPLGDVLQVPGPQAPLLAYFRNNVLHAWALPSLLAALLAQHPGVERDRLEALARRVFPFLRAELFVSWPPEALPERVAACLDAFAALGLVGRPPGAPGTAALHALARLMRPTLERYFIVLAVLVGQGSGTLAPHALEDLCFLLAQRMAFLHGAGQAELLDRASFRAIVGTLSELGWVRVADGRIAFDATLREAADDAGWLLSAETRQAIAQVTRLTDEDVARARVAFDPAAQRGA
ncbi:MAG TPA: glycerol-3-phosphate 1-O-acyltransferase PlsB [Burkholderiaceae bacterium]|nr:glycerol-3-phosphate 1-O-acyltransferase PlsB [Burkholderiaceae bacterium]